MSSCIPLYELSNFIDTAYQLTLKDTLGFETVFQMPMSPAPILYIWIFTIPLIYTSSASVIPGYELNFVASTFR